MKMKRTLSIMLAFLLLLGMNTGFTAEASEPQNLCYNANITWDCPGIAGANPAKLMFDNDFDTYLRTWSKNFEGTFFISFDEPKTFNRVVFGSHKLTPRDMDLKVYVSNDEGDNKEYTQILAERPLQSSVSTYDLPKDVTAKYVKFHIDNLDNQTTGGFTISEFQLFCMPDTVKPEITLKGETNMELDIGDEYEEPGYSANDNRDGDITEKVVVSGDTVDTSTKGIYRISYDVEDMAGNKAETEVRTVSVGIDGKPPVLTLNGEDYVVINVGETFEDPMCTAIDNVDGDISDRVVVTGEVDNTKVGKYVLKYDVSDLSGNKAETVERTVEVEQKYNVNYLKGGEILSQEPTSGKSFADKAIDDDPSTAWETYGMSESGYFEIKLDRMREINKISMSKSYVRVHDILVYSSVDGKEWEPILEDKKNATAKGEVKEYTLDKPVTTQYLKFEIKNIDYSGGYGFGIYDFSAYLDYELSALSKDFESVNLPSGTGADLKLTESGKMGSKFEWKSQNPDVMDNEGRIVSRPSGVQGEKKVVLSLTATRGKNKRSGDFEITVVPENVAEKAEVSGIAEAGILNDGDFVETAEISDSEIEFVFPSPKMMNMVSFETWGEWNTDEITIFGKIDGKYEKIGEKNDFSADRTIEFKSGEYEGIKLETKGGATRVCEILFDLTDEVAVDTLIESLEITEEKLSGITKDLIFQKGGEYGQTVEWESSDEKVVLSNGTVIRDGRNHKVEITATVSKGEVSKDKIFEITVLAKKSQSGGGSGGGGHSGGGMKVPVPAPQNTDKAETVVFSDVPVSHWAYSYIDKMYSKGLVSGTYSKTFEPDRAITRAEFIKMLVTSFNLEAKGEGMNFVDVNEDSWYYSYIKTASSLGILVGNDKGMAMAESKISREDMAVLLCRTADISGITFGKVREIGKFSDSSFISDYARASVDRLYTAGIIDGKPANTFEPQSNATRAEAVKIMASVI